MTRSAEPWLLLAVAVAVPLVTGAALYAELHPAPLPAPHEAVLHGPLLVSRTEERALGPDDWLDLAEALPEPFARTAAFCRQARHRTLPNCRNVLTAARAADAIATIAGGRRAR